MGEIEEQQGRRGRRTKNGKERQRTANHSSSYPLKKTKILTFYDFQAQCMFSAIQDEQLFTVLALTKRNSDMAEFLSYISQ